jgi:hypothetical protein
MSTTCCKSGVCPRGVGHLRVSYDSQNAVIISLNSVNKVVFVMETDCEDNSLLAYGAVYIVSVWERKRLRPEKGHKWMENSYKQGIKRSI